MPGIIIAIILLVIFIAVALVVRRGGLAGLTMMSHLNCPKCNAEFDYVYMPGASLTAIRLLGSRYFMCPVCRRWSVFNLSNTRVDPESHRCPIRVGPS